MIKLVHLELVWQKFNHLKYFDKIQAFQVNAGNTAREKTKLGGMKPLCWPVFRTLRSFPQNMKVRKQQYLQFQFSSLHSSYQLWIKRISSLECPSRLSGIKAPYFQIFLTNLMMIFSVKQINLYHRYLKLWRHKIYPELIALSIKLR